MHTLGERLFLKWVKLKDRFQASEQQLFRVPAQKETLSSVLICFPFPETNLESYQKFLRELFSIFPEVSLSVVLHRTQLNAVQFPAKTAVFVYDERDFSRFGVLRKTWLTAMPKEFALVLDLNETNSLWSAHLCRNTRAPLRLTFEKENATYFFNIILRPREGAPLQERMEQLFQTIRALTNRQQGLAA